MSEYGLSELYLYRQSPPYLVMELKEGRVFLNGKSEEQTTYFFQLLLKQQTAFSSAMVIFLTHAFSIKSEEEIRVIS